MKLWEMTKTRGALTQNPQPSAPGPWALDLPSLGNDEDEGCVNNLKKTRGLKTLDPKPSTAVGTARRKT